MIKECLIGRFILSLVLVFILLTGHTVYMQHNELKNRNKVAHKSVKLTSRENTINRKGGVKNSNASNWIKYQINDEFSVLTPAPFFETIKPASNQLVALTPKQVFQVLYKPSIVLRDSSSANELSDFAIDVIEEEMLGNGITIVSRYRDKNYSYFWELWSLGREKNNFMHIYSRNITKSGVLYELQCGSRKFNQKADIKICQKFLNSVE